MQDKAYEVLNRPLDFGDSHKPSRLCSLLQERARKHGFYPYVYIVSRELLTEMAAVDDNKGLCKSEYNAHTFNREGLDINKIVFTKWS